MKQRILGTVLLVLGLLSCEMNGSQTSQQYAVYTLSAEGKNVSGYKALAYNTDSSRIFAVTIQNELYELNQDFSRNHVIDLSSTQIETLSSIMMRNGRLYVSSWSNSNSRNTVLSVDIEGSGKTIQVGNGSYGYTHDAANGSGPWHPQAVYAGQKYLYVAANGENIRVYRLTDVLGAGWKNTAAPFCYLKTGLSIAKGSRITMYERDGELFIVSDLSDSICRFTTTTFEAGTSAQAIAPAQSLSKPVKNQQIRTFTLGKTKVAVAAGTYVYIYALPDFLSFLFASPQMTFSAIDENAFDKIRTVYDLHETGSLSFTAQGDWGVRRYSAVKYNIIGQGGMQ